jgi:crotonobetainyl-CoA:carnitine CoA-transferase CaiB-like acyl-CoA transferase
MTVRKTPRAQGAEWTFHVDNRGKRGIALDLKKPKGLEIAYEMVASADVFLTNMRLPSLEKMKMDYESLKQVN